MSVISNKSYRKIVAWYTKAMRRLEGISDNYYNSAYEIVMHNVFQPEIDLLLPFYTAYQSTLTAYSIAPASVINAVAVLQKHVLDNARDSTGKRYPNIDAYYDDTNRFPVNYRVSDDFAALSAQAGYAISASNYSATYDPDAELNALSN